MSNSPDRRPLRI